MSTGTAGRSRAPALSVTILLVKFYILLIEFKNGSKNSLKIR